MGLGSRLCAIGESSIVRVSNLSFHLLVPVATELQFFPRMLQSYVLRDRRTFDGMGVGTVRTSVRMVEQVRHDMVSHDSHLVAVVRAQSTLEYEA